MTSDDSKAIIEDQQTEPPPFDVKIGRTLAQKVAVGVLAGVVGIGTFAKLGIKLVRARGSNAAILAELQDGHPAQTREELAALRTAQAALAGDDPHKIVETYREQLPVAGKEIAAQKKADIAEANRRAPVDSSHTPLTSGVAAGLGTGLLGMLTMAGLHAVTRRRGSYKFRDTEVIIGSGADYDYDYRSITFNSDASHVVIHLDDQIVEDSPKRSLLHSAFKDTLKHMQSKRKGQYSIRLESKDNDLPGRREDLHKVFTALTEREVITAEQCEALNALSDDIIDRALRVKTGAPTLADSFTCSLSR